jgi:hypothetical protein
MSDLADEIHDARTAYSCGDWRAAYEHFSRAAETAELTTDDLSSYGMPVPHSGSRCAPRTLIGPDSPTASSTVAVTSMACVNWWRSSPLR